MKRSQVTTNTAAAGKTVTEAAQARTPLLLLVCFLLGLGVGAYWYYRATNRSLAHVGGEGSKLAEGTRAVLMRLELPVEVRFYSILDPAITSEALRAFAGRVDQLLTRYEQEAGDKIRVVRHTAPSDAAAQAATADGIKAFNREKGEVCFLGMVLACNDQKETLGQLAPEWEAALESDLSRALARVTAASPAATLAAANAAPLEAAAAAEVRLAITNLDAVSLADGKQALRVAALKEIMEVTDELQRRVKEAQQRVTEANGSEAEQQAALKQLQQLQIEQTEKLKEIAARSKAQIQALEQIKRK